VESQGLFWFILASVYRGYLTSYLVRFLNLYISMLNGHRDP